MWTSIHMKNNASSLCLKPPTLGHMCHCGSSSELTIHHTHTGGVTACHTYTLKGSIFIYFQSISNFYHVWDIHSLVRVSEYIYVNLGWLNIMYWFADLINVKLNSLDSGTKLHNPRCNCSILLVTVDNKCHFTNTVVVAFLVRSAICDNILPN